MRVFELPENEYLALRDAPAYDAVIPAPVRYDNRLSMGARMMYGEIRALSRKEGFCWASNEYFAQAYLVEVRTIQNWIRELIEAGHIKFELIENTKRKLSLAGMKIFSGGGEKNFMGGGKNFHPMKISMQKEDIRTPIIPNGELFKNGMPQSLDTPEFTEAWKSYKEFRQKKKLPLTDRVIKRTLSTLMIRPKEAVDLLDYTMERGYRGLDWDWFDNSKVKTKTQKPPVPYDD